MLGTNQKKNQGPVKGCLIPIAGLLGFIAGCYLLCSGLFLLNGGQLSFAAAKPTAVEIPITEPTPPGPGGLLQQAPSNSVSVQPPLALTLSWR